MKSIVEFLVKLHIQPKKVNLNVNMSKQFDVNGDITEVIHTLKNEKNLLTTHGDGYGKYTIHIYSKGLDKPEVDITLNPWKCEIVNVNISSDVNLTIKNVIDKHFKKNPHPSIIIDLVIDRRHDKLEENINTLKSYFNNFTNKMEVREENHLFPEFDDKDMLYCALANLDIL